MFMSVCLLISEIIISVIVACFSLNLHIVITCYIARFCESDFDIPDIHDDVLSLFNPY